MKKLWLMIALLFLTGCSAASKEIKENKGTDYPATETGIEVTTAYKEALRVANEFLIAWQNRDAQTGVTLVTDALISAYGQKDGEIPSDMESYFIGTSNPHHHSFEIVGKEKMDEDTYHFSVWMYEYYTGQDQASPPEDHDSVAKILEVVKVGENEYGEGVWKINNMP